MTDDEAIFLEALPGCEVWRSCYAPFFYEAQFCHAVRLIRLPISSFLRLADRLVDPANVTFISMIGRSGSTMLIQMFEQTGEVVAISEPSALSFIADVSHSVTLTIVLLICFYIHVNANGR